ncbi:MAG: tRNA (adenosine(37)-N6)-threonylcarbamoyltransferase complex dimerization subunit type 1 TsaB [Nocardioides sp.]|uniref:tRNA (adenosine(37)-N6)-threonylcarbamoyltransferase complex dimerization subunit type 1 TsaB n=1 Tax=Nocardioides sp. TaxID=35761 RepID=UPI0039E5D269
MLLAFDTATPQVTVALHSGEEGTEPLAEAAGDRAMKHGEELAPLIASVLAEADAVPADLTRIAVGVGPGPFTGLRVGLVTARTMGFALAIPVDGVCTLDVLALEAVETGTVRGPFQVATDARRKEVYFAAYSPLGDRLTGPVVERPDALPGRLVTIGEGTVLYPAAFPDSVGPLRPSAGWLARGVAADRFELLATEPLYLRRPDAER